MIVPPDTGDKEAALRLLNMLAPLTRRDSWWESPYPLVTIEDFLAAYREARVTSGRTGVRLGSSGSSGGFGVGSYGSQGWPIQRED